MKNNMREDEARRTGIMPGGDAKEGFIYKVHQRIPLTLKMIVITVVIGIVLSLTIDMFQTRELKKFFLAKLNERLGKQAMEDRMRFDRHVKAHIHSTKLFISQRNFSDYIQEQQWSVNDYPSVVEYRRSPSWFPSSSVLRSFTQARFALLLDAEGVLREAYGRMPINNLPDELLRPSRQLILKSVGQNFMTDIGGRPYLIASARYLDKKGTVLAILMLVSPIDDVFLSEAMGFLEPEHMVALVSSGNEPVILVSCDLDRMKVGTPLNKYAEQYLVTGQEFFDYGASEQVIKFVSFISFDGVNTLTQSIASTERNVRLVGLPVLIVAFALLMYWITRRIQLLTHRITDFSARLLGTKYGAIGKGDQLYILEDRFQRLKEEILEARDVIKREAEERLLLEKKNMEIQQKIGQLKLLQSVTQAVGVGVMKEGVDGFIPVNKQMEHFAQTCGGIENFKTDGSGDREHTMTDVEGVKRIFHISIPDIFESEKIMLVQDVTKIREQTAALEYLAMHDSLTGLPNRTLLQDRLQFGVFACQRENKSLALLMMDLNRFKEINDTLGHHVGDLVLKEVGERLPMVLRKSDTIARLGGDEFAVVLPDTDALKAGRIAEKLLKVLEESFNVEEHRLYVGASIGMVLYPDHGEDASTLLKRADVAMYTAKHEQCGVSVYHADLDHHSIRHLVMLNDLRSAIENEDLSLHYQPKICCKTGSVCGVEALVRWDHSDHGFISPDEFISLAETNGVMKSLTMWVLNAGLQQYRKWLDAGINMDLCMSVNLSPRNLQDVQLPREVEECLNTWGIPPECLEFEITEGAVMIDPDYALNILNVLDTIGVRLSIDDFGSGYSSLAYLKKLPVDEIKIDKSFVMNMVSDESDAMIVRSTIDLAHNLGLNVIAEGVESGDVLNILNELGCDKAQGYYICRPVPADTFIQWLNETEWIKKKRMETIMQKEIMDQRNQGAPSGEDPGSLT